ncbi:MAG: sigma 54-interacting transcriptional regulator [Rhodobacter sp.]|nr:sigma 54-interacting transcriptional regulator [Rhodobacter sp.]
MLSEVPLRSTVENRTRPDFATQRRLSPALNRLLSRAGRAIRQGARILITGESGVGKSEIARFLHAVVADARDPFVIVNCATDSATDLDAALFAPDGLIEQAMGGTLFLDEVAEIPLSVQARLLGFLEDGVARNTGPRRDPPLRLIAATNAELQALVREGRFPLGSILSHRSDRAGRAAPAPDARLDRPSDRPLFADHQSAPGNAGDPAATAARLAGRLRLSRQHPRAFEHHPARRDLHGRRDRHGRAFRRVADAGARGPRSDRGCVAGSAHRGSPVRTGADRQGDPHPWQQAQGGQGAGRGYRHHRQKDG